MTIRIADLIPLKESVEIAEGKFLDVNPISLPQIVQLIADHKEAFLSLYVSSQVSKPDYSLFLTVAPALVADVIAMGSNRQDEIKDIKRMPGTVQLIALEAIWRLSVPDAKKLGEVLKRVVASLQHFKGTVEKETGGKPTSTDSSTILQNP